KLAADLVLECSFEDVDDLFARMCVHGRRLSGRYLDDHLEGLTSGNAEIVPLQVDALYGGLLRQHEAGCGNQYCDDQCSISLHVEIPIYEVIEMPREAPPRIARALPTLRSGPLCRLRGSTPGWDRRVVPRSPAHDKHHREIP